jgi:outer membrane murein-binding lipoprotein Lpp
LGDDWQGSGYDIDLMSSALDALAAHNAQLAREIESTRPDLYPAEA